MFVIPRSGPAPKPRVLKGNWYEEHLATEFKLSEYAEKRQDDDLKSNNGEKNVLKWTCMWSHSQKVSQPYEWKVPRSIWKGSDAQASLIQKPIHFGDLVQIKSKKGLVLTFDLYTKTFVPCPSDKGIGNMEYILLGSTFKGNSNPAPISRNVFEIAKCPGEEYEDDVLKLGIKFRLLIPHGRFDQQYAVKSVPVTIAKMANQSCTEVVLSNQIEGYDTAWYNTLFYIKSHQIRQVQDINRKKKTGSDTYAISNQPLLINHCLSNAFMTCFDDLKKKYILDDGCQIQSDTDIDCRKYECYQWNIIPLDLTK